MPFKPLHGDHAISEVIFQISLDRALSPDEIRTLRERHEELTEDLPSMHVLAPGSVDDAGAFVIQFSTKGHAFPPSPTLEMSSFKRDGRIEWRLQCAGPLVTVNCASYTRWERIWEKASSYLSFALSGASEPQPQVANMVLQYIDLFVWVDEEEYDISQLINLKSSLVLPGLLERGKHWHLHQGWFTDPSSLEWNKFTVPGGRILERLNIDSFESKVVGFGNARLSVRIDNQLRFDLGDHVILGNSVISNEIGSACFNTLHDLAKHRLRDLLVDEMIKGIGLNA